MGNSDVELIAHLMRRAGFGATRDQLEVYATKGYEATVEELLNPGVERRMGDDLIRRFHPELSGMMGVNPASLKRAISSWVDKPGIVYIVPASEPRTKLTWCSCNTCKIWRK